MVGRKQKVKGSNTFYKCYTKYCSVQNTKPLRNVFRGDGTRLDFCVDSINYQDWQPILKALSCERNLQSVSIRCSLGNKTVLENLDSQKLACAVTNHPAILTKYMLERLVEILSDVLTANNELVTLRLVGLPLGTCLNTLCKGLEANRSLQHLSLARSAIGDAGCLVLCRTVRNVFNIQTLNLDECQITDIGAGYIADLVKFQKNFRYSQAWLYILRYRPPHLDSMAGLRRILVSGNQFGDQGLTTLVQELTDDLWIKELKLDFQIID